MLDHLRVVNLGVLEDAAIEPSSGFTVVTGETGAGKTLLLGGLRLLLGGKADAGIVGPGGEQAQVDGLISNEDGETGASRVVPAAGRSRAYLEGAVVSASRLGETLGDAFEIVGQHDQLAITRAAHVLRMVDTVGEAESRQALREYRTAWERLQDALGRQRALGGDITELARELDLAGYQANEIAGAGLNPGDDERLEIELGRLRNVSELRDQLAEAFEATVTMAESAGALVDSLRKTAALDLGLGDLASRSELLAESLSEIARDVRSAADEVADDPARREELEERLTAIGDLKRKYGRTLDDVIEHGERMSIRVSELEALLDDAGSVDTLVAQRSREVQERAAELTAVRSAAAERLATVAKGHLGDLGLEAARIEFVFESVDPGPSGADRVTLQFASDQRLQPGPVSSVASGGELSRLVLALRLAGRDRSVGTLIFDEVDTGIGGKTALAMGEKIADLATESQVMCVTHLAQVAAFADTHYVVERGADGTASVRRVDGPERLSELSRMLAGQPDSESAKTAAADLLALAGGNV